jgi:hypothetical protein
VRSFPKTNQIPKRLTYKALPTHDTASSETHEIVSIMRTQSGRRIALSVSLKNYKSKTFRTVPAIFKAGAILLQGWGGLALPYDDRENLQAR